MKPYDGPIRKRRKRDHKVKCLRCEQVFLSEDLKTNRVCLKCKDDYAWKFMKDRD